MAVYVDALVNWGWKIRGRATPSCHMFADTDDELHAMATAIGLKRSWAQRMSDPLQMRRHYDLVPSKRAAAVESGAIEISLREVARRTRAERLSHINRGTA